MTTIKRRYNPLHHGETLCDECERAFTKVRRLSSLVICLSHDTKALIFVRKKESKKSKSFHGGFLVYLLKFVFVFVLVSLRLKESVRVAPLVVGGERILWR